MPSLFESLSNTVRYFLRGPVPSYTPTQSDIARMWKREAPAIPRHTSAAFEAHVLRESARDLAAPVGKQARMKSFSSAWDETEGLGIRTDLRRADDNLTEQQRKELCLEVYRINPWVSACCDAIAKRITSGGFSIEPVEQDKANPEHAQQLRDFCLRINDNWDFLQLLRSIILDLLIFGEAYVEIVRKNGLPYQLHKIDCITMSYTLDRHGNITGYQQTLLHANETILLPPDDIIRWWLPHPKANMIALSPIERILDAINLDKQMVNFITRFFEKGAKAPYWIKSPGEADEAERFLEWFTENYTGDRNAHAPIVTWGGAEITEFKAGALEIDFPLGRERAREEILAGYNVPPMVVGVIKTAGLGGTGEDQEKSFQYNTCDPVKQMVMEKFNYRLVQRGFGIHDYIVTTRYADYRNDKDITEVQDKRIRNGSLTINEARQEMGKAPYPEGEGGSTGIIITTKEITPVSRASDLDDEQAQQAQLAMQSTQADILLKKAQAKQALMKAEPPAPPPAPPAGPTSPPPEPGAPPGPGSEHPVPKPAAGDERSSPAHRRSERQRPAMLTQHTGMMLAFFPDPATAQALALPGGEPPDDLHVTLAFLGDMAEEPGDDLLRPHTSPGKMHEVCAVMAAQVAPLAGRIAGYGRFDAPAGEPTPVIALPDVPGLTDLRTRLVDALKAAGYFVAEDHGYTPHITLAYCDASDPLPITGVAGLPLSFDTLWLCIGDERRPFALGSQTPSREHLAPHLRAWQPGASEDGARGTAQRGFCSTIIPESLHLAEEVNADLERWMERAIEDAREQRVQRGFCTTAIPRGLHKAIQVLLDHAAGEDQVLAAFAWAEQRLHESSFAPQIEWEPDDVESRLQGYREQGIEELTWTCDPYACDLCIPNEGETRKLGETFPNGARLPQCHTHCRCCVYPPAWNKAQQDAFIRDQSRGVE